MGPCSVNDRNVLTFRNVNCINQTRDFKPFTSHFSLFQIHYQNRGPRSKCKIKSFRIRKVTFEALKSRILIGRVNTRISHRPEILILDVVAKYHVSYFTAVDNIL